MIERSSFYSDIQALAKSAIESVHPAKALGPALRIRDGVIRAGDILAPFELPAWDLAVIAIGKASESMARAASEILGDRIAHGVAIVRDEIKEPISKFEVYKGGHPHPNEDSLIACNQVEDFARRYAQAKHPFLILLSGGASALVGAPLYGLSRDDLLTTNQWLLNSGHGIRVLNLVRRKITRLGSGGLSLLIGQSPNLTLAVSDVVHGSPEDIGSGPTLPDPASNVTTMRVITKKGMPDEGFPPHVWEFMRKARDGEIPSKPDKEDSVFRKGHFVILRDNQFARRITQANARQIGYENIIDGGLIRGESRDFARKIARILQSLVKRKQFTEFPVAYICGGESAVTIDGPCGIGGRNMELALALAIDAGELPFEWAVLCFGTDGSDGTSSANGAYVDWTTLQRAKEKGLDPSKFLKEHNAHEFFESLEDLHITGPTGTNVADLLILIIGHPTEADPDRESKGNT